MIATVKRSSARSSLSCGMGALLVCAACASEDPSPASTDMDGGVRGPNGQMGGNDMEDGPGQTPEPSMPGMEDDDPSAPGAEDDDPTAPGSEDDDPAAPGTEGPGTSPTTAPTAGDPTSGGVQPMRRLSHVEYENTLRALFPSVVFELPTLPAETRIDGFSNNADSQVPSDLLAEQYLNAAMSIARALDAEQIAELAPCEPSTQCAEQFVTDFGYRAFRRPLSDEEVESFVDTFVSGPGAEDFELGVRLVVMGMLQSASFLYRPELGEAAGGGTALTQHEVASRLSYLIWASTPDDALLGAADSGALGTPEEVAGEVERLLADDRARVGLVNFFSEWLVLPEVEHVLNRREDWDEAVSQELVESAERFVYDQIFVGGGSSDDLMTSNVYPATAAVAELLGATTSGNGFRDVEADPAERAGFLTHPAFLAAYGYAEYPSPVLRGVYIMDRVLCSPPQPPPPGVTIMLPEAPEAAAEPRTNREAYDQVTSQSAECVTCHSLINPLGFAFENYDTLGRYRTEDGGFPVDATGASFGFDFQNGLDLVQQIATSDRYRECVVSKLVNYGTGGGAVATDAALRQELLTSFAEGGYSLRELLVAFATHQRFSRWLVVPDASN